MAKKSEQAAESVVAVEKLEVKQHLDRDPNDPRLQKPTPVLPSLNDADQN